MLGKTITTTQLKQVHLDERNLYVMQSDKASNLNQFTEPSNIRSISQIIDHPGFVAVQLDNMRKFSSKLARTQFFKYAQTVDSYLKFDNVNEASDSETDSDYEARDSSDDSENNETSDDSQ